MLLSSSSTAASSGAAAAAASSSSTRGGGGAAPLLLSPPCRRSSHPHAFRAVLQSCRASQRDRAAAAEQEQQQQQQHLRGGRRGALVAAAAAAFAAASFFPPAAQAIGFKKDLKKRKVPLDEYAVSDADGLRYFDAEEGRGRAAARGDAVTVHFDCVYRGIDAVSSRYARTLGGNRTVAEPLELVAGEPVNLYAKKAGDSAGGLFAGGSGPKPPPAISTAVIGMKAGGRRTVYVDSAALGYPNGNQEIPAGAAFELRVEMLSVR